MNVYDTANRLAKELKESKEYMDYKKAKEEIAKQADKKKKIEDFETLRYEVQVLAMQGQEVSEEKNKKLQEMYALLVQNQDIREYFDLEVKFNVMIADVNKMIAEAVADVL